MSNGYEMDDFASITIARNKQEAKKAEEALARVQDLPENADARIDAELRVAEATAKIAAGGCVVDIPGWPVPYNPYNPYSPGLPGIPQLPPLVPTPSTGGTTTTNKLFGKKENTMDVYIIWAIVPDQPDAPWAVSVWDAESRAGDEDLFLEDLANQEELYGARFVRVTRTTVNYDAVVGAFGEVTI